MAVMASGGIADVSADERASAVRLVLLVILIGTVIRLAISAATGLGMDESYSVGNARQLMQSYVDHPPLHYWLAGLAMRVFGSEASIVVRLPFILLFAGSTWLMFTLTARLFGPRAGLWAWAVAAFNIAPVFTYAHATWVLPDGPTIFFMLATANVVTPILLDDPNVRRPLLRWLVAGAFGGLAILSKYTGAFVFVGVLAFVLTVPSARRHLLTPGPWLATALALIIFSPVVLWNMDHGMVGLFFQSRRLPGSDTLQPMYLLQEVGGEALYVHPLLFVPLVIVLYRALRAGPAEPHGWLMAMIAIGPIAIFTAVSLWAHSQPHWPMPGWVFTMPLFGRHGATLVMERPKFARGYMAVAAAGFALLLGAFTYQAVRGGLIPASLGAQADPTIDLLDWRALPPELEARGLLGPDAVVASPIWMFAGKSSYALGPDVPVVCACDDPQQFRYRYDQNQWVGRDMPVVIPRLDNAWLYEAAASFFDRLDPLPPIEIKRAGKPVLMVDLFMGRNLHPIPN